MKDKSFKSLIMSPQEIKERKMKLKQLEEQESNPNIVNPFIQYKPRKREISKEEDKFYDEEEEIKKINFA